MKIDDKLRHAADLARTSGPARPGDAELFDRAADRIQELEKLTRWIPFSEQTPPPDEQVLVFGGGHYRHSVIAHSPSVLNPWEHREGIDPTHWCPLPPDPEDAEAEGDRVVEVSP